MLRRIVYQGSHLHRIQRSASVVEVIFTRVSKVQTSSRLFDISANEYEKTCKTTLDSLCEYFETILENNVNADVNLSDGVLTVRLGSDLGTYVINKQSPNKQIWLSSPLSGPKRYDYVSSRWVYRHDDCELNMLLTKELRDLLKDNKIDFTKHVSV